MKRVPAITAAVAAAGVLAAPVLACGGGPVGENLVASTATKAAIGAAYQAAHPRAAVARAGRLYFGRYDGDLYAVAPYSRTGTIRTAILMRHPRGPWQLVKETRARAACSDYVPVPLIEKWWLAHADGASRCHRPRTRSAARSAGRTAVRSD